MFAVNFRLPKKKPLFIIFVIFTILFFCLILVLEMKKANGFETKTLTDSFSASQYVLDYGINTDVNSLVVDEIVVPSEFDDVYKNYNEIQKKQGFDLQKYIGCRLTRYTYKVLNFGENQENVFVEILTYKGKVVAADLYSTELDGFILPLK